MECDNIFCIYWKDKYCMLDEISIDAAGTCRERIDIMLGEDILEPLRRSTRERLEKEDKRF